MIQNVWIIQHQGYTMNTVLTSLTCGLHILGMLLQFLAQLSNSILKLIISFILSYYLDY